MKARSIGGIDEGPGAYEPERDRTYASPRMTSTPHSRWPATSPPPTTAPVDTAQRALRRGAATPSRTRCTQVRALLGDIQERLTPARPLALIVLEHAGKVVAIARIRALERASGGSAERGGDRRC